MHLFLCIMIEIYISNTSIQSDMISATGISSATLNIAQPCSIAQC